MAHKIATGLKVPALATVSNIYCDDCVCCTSKINHNPTPFKIVSACRCSPVGVGPDHAGILPHMGSLG